MSLNDILEWQAIVSLRSYLIFTLPVVDEAFDPTALDEAFISSDNARENFEFELTRIFVRPDPPLHIGETKVDECRPKLAKLVSLLDSLAGLHRLRPVATPQETGRGLAFQHIFSTTKYKRLWVLLENLDASGAPLNLIKGRFGPAFDLPASDVVAGHLKTVQDVNFLLDSLPLSQRGTSASEESKLDLPDTAILDDSVREYATAAFDIMFGHLKDCNPPHSAMLYLRTQQDDNITAPKASLDLFVSSCPHHRGWQEIQCVERKNLEYGPRKITNLCRLIQDARKQGLMVHVAGDEIQNITQVPPRTRHRRDAPSKSLRSLILCDAFKPLNIDHVVSDRFSRAEKRSLAMDILSSLSRLLGSGWVGEGWCSKDLFFLGKKVDEERSKTPFGPYISCSAVGPPLTDLERWRLNLGDPPILIFLAKLLLEIDLGKDLDEHIEEALEEDPDEDLGLVLSDIWEDYKWDLDYSEAIEACLNYHMTRQVHLELGQIDEEPGQWSEWDRRYIQGVISKLADPATSAPQPERKSKAGKKHQQNGWWMAHMSRSASPASPPPVNLSAVPLRPMSELSSDSGLAAPMGSATSFNQSRPGSTPATTIDMERCTLSASRELATEEYSHSPADRRDANQEAVPQMPQPINNMPLNMSAWLDGADQSVVAPQDAWGSRLTPEPGVTEEDQVGVLFDGMEFPVLHEHQKEGAELAERYWDFMRVFNKKHFPPPLDEPPAGETATDGTNGQTAKSRRVKIALIDTGVDLDDPFISPEVESGRIKGCSWVGEEDDIRDSCGHGTHLVRLVLKVNKSADILVAKVSKGKSFTPKNTQNIVEAIHWAAEQDADIISLSLGFQQEVKPINDALDEVINPKRKTPGARSRLVFAAAANWGFNRSLAFPASKKGVICVHGTFGNGYDGQLGPSSGESLKNFPIGTLGVTIESQWNGRPVWLKGTSFATPIAAAVAANVLEFARRNVDAQVQSELERYRGMKAVLQLMCRDGNSSSYLYCAPWVLYEKVVDNEKIRTTAQIRRAIELAIEELNY